jgi:hypothetical protein
MISGPNKPRVRPETALSSNQEEGKMISRVLNYVKLPYLLITLYAALRFIIGVAGVPYSPRGNAMFSVVGITLISCVYFGALSEKIGGFSWGGAALVGLSLGLFSQIIISLATIISYVGGFETSYFIHWDALNTDPVKLNIPMAEALTNPEKVTTSIGQVIWIRARGLVINSILCTVAALIGRALAALAPQPQTAR